MTREEFAEKIIFPMGGENVAFAQFFKGQSYLNMLTTQGVPIGNVTFEPGCRNNWHIHQAKSGGGQILLCTAGRGYYQEWEKPARELHPGEICLLDCYCPHLYQTSEVWELEWIHFDGGNSRAFFDYLRDDMPFFYTLLDSPAQLEAIWNRLYETLLKKNNINELLISQDISQILTLLGLSKERREKQKTASDFMDISLKYIHRHLDEDISLNALAARVSLSPFYFTRKFKEETGYTPYRYILISRINLAKFYLKSSRDTVKNIGFSCGFHSEHSFCTTFKKEVGVTPTEYRYRSE